MPVLTRPKLQALIDAYHLSRYSDAILATSKPAIQLTLTRVDEGTIPVGASKFGGSPDVPPDFVYPDWQERPLVFIGQLRLSDVHEYDVENLLPPSGYLHFFYDSVEQPWGMYGQRDGWRVYYTADEATPLARLPHPVSRLDDPTHAVKPLPACNVSFQLDFTEPPLTWLTDRFPNLFNTRRRINDDAYNLYDALFKVRGRQITQVLGNPHPIQYEVEYDAQVNSHNLSYGPADGDARAALERDMYDWRLLLQVDSDEQLGATWGDVGRLYYMIRKDDLAARRFEACWLIMQCS